MNERNVNTWSGGYRRNGEVILALQYRDNLSNLSYRHLKDSGGFNGIRIMNSAMPVQRSTNWAMGCWKQVNLLGSCVPVKGLDEWKKYIHLNCGLQTIRDDCLDCPRITSPFPLKCHYDQIFTSWFFRRITKNSMKEWKCRLPFANTLYLH